MFKHLAFALAVLFVLGNCDFALGQQGLQFKFDGETQTFLPLGHTRHSVVALKQDGYMVEIKARDIKNPKVVPKFRSRTQSQVRGDLLREFGKSFDVTGTGNYLVVHPRGAKDLWADRFEDLYRSMVHFFRTRGYSTGKLQFPLVSVVFYSKSQYLEYNRRVLKSNANGSLGVYYPTTNRIYLYDATRGTGKENSLWAENLATVMHEAAHQTAFNTGIHVRGGETPYWIAEGIGCLFEAKGIHNSFRYKQTKDRINYGRMRAFQRTVKGNEEELIASVIASDDMFKRDPGRAYATAWALTFYLSERESRKYIRYLKLVSKHKPVTEYRSSDRVKEFTRVFGKDYKMLALRVRRFVEGLPD